MKNYKATKLFIDDFLSSSAADVRARLDPVYNKYGIAQLADILDCNTETIRNYRRRSAPRKPTLQNYMLLCSLLENKKKT